MFCRMCGARLEEDMLFCMECGAAVPGAVPPAKVPTPMIPVTEEIPSYTAPMTQEQTTAASYTTPVTQEQAPVSADAQPQTAAQTTYAQPQPAAQTTYAQPQPASGNPYAQTAAQTTYAQPAGEPVQPQKSNTFFAKALAFLKAHKLPSIAVAAGVVVIVIVAIVLANVLGAGSGATKKYSIEAFYDLNEGQTVFFCDGKEVGSVSAKVELYRYGGEDDGLAIFYNESDYQEMFCVTEKGCYSLANSVSDMIISFQGNIVLYRNDYTLYRYDVKAQKEQVVSEEVSYYTVSPNGSDILYLNMDEELCLNNGNNIISEEGYMPLAIANNHKYMYVMDQDSNLYLISQKGVVDKLNKNVIGSIFNKDLSQVLSYDGEKTYLNINGGEKVKVSKHRIVPTDYYLSSKGRTMVTSNIAKGNIMSTEKFLSETYSDSTDMSLQYLSQDCKLTRMAGSITSWDTEKDVVYYSKSNRLYRVKKSANASDEKITGKMADSSSFKITSDGSRVYYCAENHDLYEWINGEEKVVAENVQSFYIDCNENVFVVCANTNDAYYSSYDLGVIQNGKYVEIATDIFDLKTSVVNGVYYSTDYENGSCKVYYVGKSLKPVQLLENADV